MKTSFYILLLVLFTALSSFRCADENTQGQSSYVFKFGHLANEGNVWHQAAEKFAETVSRKSEGRIEIKVYPSEQLGKELDIITGILAGTADMTITGESLQNWTGEAGMCAVPFLIRDSQHMRKIAGGPIGKEIEAKIVSNIGLRPVAWFERGARNLTSDRPIRTPADLNGIILRVPNVPLYVQTWAALGAKPTPMAFSEVFTSLQQGTIQAQENPYALIYSAGFYEVQEYLNLTEHVKGWVYVVIGEKQFQSMPADLQGIFLQSAKEMQAYEHQLFLAEQEMLITHLKGKGMEFIEVDKAAFKQKAGSVVFDNLTAEQKAFYSRIVEVE